MQHLVEDVKIWFRRGVSPPQLGTPNGGGRHAFDGFLCDTSDIPLWCNFPTGIHIRLGIILLSSFLTLIAGLGFSNIDLALILGIHGQFSRMFTHGGG